LQRDGGGSRDCGEESRTGMSRRQHSQADWGQRGKRSKDRKSAGESLQQKDNASFEFCTRRSSDPIDLLSFFGSNLDLLCNLSLVPGPLSSWQLLSQTVTHNISTSNSLTLFTAWASCHTAVIHYNLTSEDPNYICLLLSLQSHFS
jgi:hypothetical protein